MKSRPIPTHWVLTTKLTQEQIDKVMKLDGKLDFDFDETVKKDLADLWRVKCNE